MNNNSGGSFPPKRNPVAEMRKGSSTMIGDSKGRSEIITPSFWREADRADVDLTSDISVYKKAYSSGRPVADGEFGRIGIGITTHNRPAWFKKTLDSIFEFLPAGSSVVVVDDASSTNYASDNYDHGHYSYIYHRFNTNAGIAKAKNKCLEMLSDCDHIFLFDDDTYPIVDQWWVPYCQSKESHLMYIFQNFANGSPGGDMTKLYDDGQIAAYSHVRGCMLYIKHICLEKAGGMDVRFGKWGHEHGDYSNRIHNFGLTTFRYMDVSNSKGLFYSGDEHKTAATTFPGKQRYDALDRTKAIYEEQKEKAVYREFRELDSKKKPLFLSAYFTTLPDPQRPGVEKEFWTPDFADYAGSVIKHGQKAIILTDRPNCDIETSLTKHITVPVSINPYFQRWISYYEYLIKHRDEISWVFMTDCTDVEVLKVPVPERGRIYVGDEAELVNSKWLTTHHQHPTLLDFYKKFCEHQLLNAGICGGYIEDVLPFVRSIIDTYQEMIHDEQLKKSKGPGITDMATFNYVARTKFSDKISHGLHVNTPFKANARNDISWFKHK